MTLGWWLISDVGGRILGNQHPESVTNITKLSPTHLVSKIRHQHRCNRFFPYLSSLAKKNAEMFWWNPSTYRKTNLILFIFEFLNAQHSGMMLVFYTYHVSDKLIKLLMILFKFDENFVRSCWITNTNCYLHWNNSVTQMNFIMEIENNHFQPLTVAWIFGYY